MILVKDDFFRTDLCSLIAKDTQFYQWRYDHKSDVNNPNHNKFFVSCLWAESSETTLFHKLWTIIHSNIDCIAKYYCWRIIANGQVKGQDGNWHRDHGDKTVLYFPLEWAPEWGGATYFQIGDSEMEIHYKQNRLVIFDSDILHYGSAPKIDNVLRISIAFNLRGQS